MKIWTIKIECVGGWYLEAPASKLCEIEPSMDLNELCDFILESFEFDNDHLHEFFVARNMRNNSQVIQDEASTLDEIFPLEKNQYLFMHFDFGDDWVFKVTRNRKQAKYDNTRSYPRIIEHKGKNPEQYPMCEDE